MSTPRNYEQAAVELGVTQSWLEEMTPRVPLPHAKFAVGADNKPSTKGRGVVVFYDADIDAIRAMFAVRPDGSPIAQGAARDRMRPVTRRRAS